MHAPLLAAWPQSSRRVLNVVEPVRPPGYDFDASVEWWFADADALRTALAQSPLAQVRTTALDACCSVAASVFMATAVTHRRP